MLRSMKVSRCRTHPDSRSAPSPGIAPTAPPRLLYSRAESAYLLSLSLRAISYLIARGDLRTKRHGGRVMVTHAELLRQATLDDREPIVPQKKTTKAVESRAGRRRCLRAPVSSTLAIRRPAFNHSGSAT